MQPLKTARSLLSQTLGRRLSGSLTARGKARTLIRYGTRNRIPTLIETGTYHGSTVAGCLRHFERIYTIELDDVLYEAARDRFSNEPTVTVIHGDSYTELSRLASEVTGPALFWLDAHYSSGDTAKGAYDPPLPWELRAIVDRAQPDVVLIDDARLMGVSPGYPTLDQIHNLVDERASNFEVRHDIIRITLA